MAKNVGKKVALGAVIAGLAGYVAGILTAPKSGKETRQDILNSANKAKTEAEKKLKALLSELNQKIDSTKKAGNKLTGKAKQEYEKVLESAGNAKEKAREILSAIHEGDADDPDLQQAIRDAKAALKNLEKYAKK